MKENLEIETKYDANLASISLEQFRKACYSIGNLKYKYISGNDIFYSNKKDKNSFFRYREVDNDIELTFKRKLNKNNNIIRTEHNIPLSEPLLDGGKSFCKEMGYVFDTYIYKVADIFIYEDFIACYYTVFDENILTNLSGRSFIEIELKNENFKNKKHCMQQLDRIEKLFYDVGVCLSKKIRLKESLFEIYRKKRR